MTDTDFMRRAIELATEGGGWVNPNPQVGAVLVKDGRVIGEGYHERFGEAHAEKRAIAAAVSQGKLPASGLSPGLSMGSSSRLPAGATLYVTLEPCCHTGKTPPCVDAIIEQGISRVVIGSNDPNPEVAGKGIDRLRSAGIEVTVGVLREECDRLNRIFFHYIQTGLPFVLLKYAMTADGKAATHTGASRWVTGEVARADVHSLRARYAAIMVGIGTVLADDPLLNCRLKGGHQPVRVICDSNLRIPLESQIVQTAREFPTLIVYVEATDDQEKRLEKLGCEILQVKSSDRQIDTREIEGMRLSSKRGVGQAIDLLALMKLLGERGLDSVLLEGGPTLAGAALQAGVVNAVRSYIAPKLFGGAEAPSPVEGRGVAFPAEAFFLQNARIETFGSDFCIEGDVVRGLREADETTAPSEAIKAIAAKEPGDSGEVV